MEEKFVLRFPDAETLHAYVTDRDSFPYNQFLVPVEGGTCCLTTRSSGHECGFRAARSGRLPLNSVVRPHRGIVKEPGNIASESAWPWRVAVGVNVRLH